MRQGNLNLHSRLDIQSNDEWLDLRHRVTIVNHNRLRVVCKIFDCLHVFNLLFRSDIECVKCLFGESVVVDSRRQTLLDEGKLDCRPDNNDSRVDRHVQLFKCLHVVVPTNDILR